MWIVHHENTCKPTYTVPNIQEPTPIHGPHTTHTWASYNTAIKPTLDFLKEKILFFQTS